jgi:hypothetical protein
LCNRTGGIDPPTIECGRKVGPFELLGDVALRCVPPPHLASPSSTKKTLKLGLPLVGGEVIEEVKRGHVQGLETPSLAAARVARFRNLGFRVARTLIP